MRLRKLLLRPLMWLAVPLLAACAGHAPAPTAVDALPLNAMRDTVMLAETKDGLDALDAGREPVVMLAEAQTLLTGLGMAQVAGQPGQTLNERRLMAVRAGRMEAMRDLTEQVHGLRLTAQTTIRDAVVIDDSLAATVSGSIRGARTVRISPTSDDTYEVQLALNADTVAYILRVAGSGL